MEPGKIVVPTITAVSDIPIAWNINRPIPGHKNTVSVIMAPGVT